MRVMALRQEMVTSSAGGLGLPHSCRQIMRCSSPAYRHNLIHGSGQLCVPHILDPASCRRLQSPVCNTDHILDLATATLGHSCASQGPCYRCQQMCCPPHEPEERTAARPLTWWLECHWWLPQQWLVVSAAACPPVCQPHHQLHFRSAPACQGLHEPGNCRADSLRASM